MQRVYGQRFRALAVVCFHACQRFRARPPNSLIEADAQANPELEMRATDKPGAGGSAMIFSGTLHDEPQDAASKIMMLKTMLDKGLVTQEEYERKKNELLDQL